MKPAPPVTEWRSCRLKRHRRATADGRPEGGRLYVQGRMTQVPIRQGGRSTGHGMASAGSFRRCRPRPRGRRSLCTCIQFRLRAQHGEAVSEARWNVALPEIRGRQLDRDPPSERRRSDPDVNGHVVDRPDNDPHQFCLRAADLQMQTAQGTRDRSRVIVLYEGVVDSERSIPLRVKRFEEEPAGITVDIGFDDQNLAKLRGRDAHLRNPVRRSGGGIARSRWIPSGAPVRRVGRL